ncbi:MAG TPA: serine O-acetyltransferase [Candidatus Limnocylindrales bacterium]
MTETIDHDQDHAFAELLAGDRALHSRIYPLKRDVAAFTDALLGILFPQLSDDAHATPADLAARLVLVRRDLRRLIVPLTDEATADRIIPVFADALPRVHAALLEDGDAILAGDPAAESLDEVVAAYPGFLAIAIHRLAHELYVLEVPILPRLLAEVAHTRTGIDIHPGASIGRGFCIDHGTGVVVGETAVIGDRVKLYQGVTLGALSVVKDLAGHKRHPTIGDRVVVYANATVLGGDTVVGSDTIIGGNVFVTSSVPAGSVLYQTSRSRVRRADEGFDEIDFVI